MDEKDGQKVKSSSASMIDLKAELFRKQEELRQQKLQSENSKYIKGKPSTSNKKPSLFSRKNAGVTKRAEKDYEEKVEEENVFDRSKKSLEKKARLYEQISSSRELPEEDGSGVYLVDFQRKAMDDVGERLEASRRDAERREREAREAEEERLLQARPVPEPETPDDEWVDYVDAFGRSRRCLRKDLPTVHQQDSRLQERKRKKDEEVFKGQKAFQELRDKAGAPDAVPNLLSRDMARELERQKWEQQELQQMEQEKEGPIHYADVHHNEVCTHGVGFYKFDKDEEARQAQMDQLQQLRQQTKLEQSKSERIKEKRKAALAARLAKVKQKKRERLGLPEEPEEEAGKAEDDDIGPKVSEQTKVETEPLTRDDSWRQTTPSTREWDQGKQVSLEASERLWLEKQRAERDKEFAPPSFYFDTPSNQSSDKSTRAKVNITTENQANKTKADKHSSVDISNIIGQKLHEIRESTRCETKHGNEDQGQKSYSVTGEVPQGESNVSKSNNVQTVTDIPLPATLPEPPKVDANIFTMPPPPPPIESSAIHSATDYTTMQPTIGASLHQQDFTVPPPNFTIPPPNHSVPPQMFQVPPPNFSMPPPGFQPVHTVVLPQMPVTQSSIQNVYPLNSNQQSSVEMANVQQTTSEAKPQQSNEIPAQKVIPKMDILDTRLMESD